MSGRSDLQLLDVRGVAELLNISQRQCWRMSSMAEAGLDKLARGFPKPVRITPRVVRWRLRDVESYVAHLAGEEN